VRHCLIACIVATVSLAAHADAGRLQMRQVAGPFVVSLFTTPEVLGVGTADVSALVEQRAGEQVVLDADVSIVLTHPDAAPLSAHLTHTAATNRLMQAAHISLPSPGLWHAVITVREGGSVAAAATDLQVSEHSTRRGTVWFFAASPIAVVLVFLWVQSEKRRLRVRRLRHAG
jgi:hypothetical protein